MNWGDFADDDADTRTKRFRGASRLWARNVLIALPHADV